MGRQIIKQPDGKYCVFSSLTDDFICWDATPEEIIEMEVSYARETITERINKTVKDLEAGGKPYYQFTKDFKEAVDSVRPEDSEAMKEFKDR